MRSALRAKPVKLLDDAMERIVRVFEEGDRHAKIQALCMMAHVVGRYPPGEQQDWAEDWLSGLMCPLHLSADELALVRHFRS